MVNRPGKTAGLTLLEIIFACAIFLVLMGIIATTFQSTTKTYFHGNKKMKLQNYLRTILDVMSAELRQCYDIDSIIISAGMAGPDIRFNKSDTRKKMKLTVEYVFNPSQGTVIRNDYDIVSGTQMSSATLGENVDQLVFIFDAAKKEVIMLIKGDDPDSPSTGTIELKTAVTLRSGEDLMAVKYTGVKQESGASSLWTSGP